MESILIIDDEINIRNSLEDILNDEGYKVFSTSNGMDGLDILEKNIIDIVLLDVKLPKMNGLEVLEKINENLNNLEIIMISGHSNIEIAVKATRLGAFDFLEKPFELEKVVLSVKNACEKLRLKRKTESLIKSSKYQQEIIGDSKEIKRIMKQIKKAAPTNGTVLISGESGVGK
ncbi:sigma-54-dependent Fis family transcriptional regulator, partial [Candidatus Dependentiae bacterium]|nr:sigma-54-dependent Fis family transcriptional regulator [Candidatus Dependentiae bacterium]